MRKRIAAVIAAMMLPAAASAGFFSAPPLWQLAERLPQDAAGDIVLIDMEASRREILPLVTVDDRINRTLIPISGLAFPAGFDQDYLFLNVPEEGLQKAMGFGLDGIDQMGGWGSLPDVHVILRGPGFGGADAALEARGFDLREIGGVPVRHRQDDFAIDLQRRDEDPFSGAIGGSARFALRDGEILFARSWPGVEAMLAEGPRLTDDAAAAAILGAADEGAGSLVQIYFPEEMPRRAGLADAILGANAVPEAVANLERHVTGPDALPGVPPYERWAMVGHQDGRRMTGTLALVYRDAADAEAALARIAAMIPVVDSVVARKPLAEVLPYEMEAGVAAFGGRHVAMLSFAQEMPPEEPANLINVMNTPFWRLLQMYFSRDLWLLIGAD